MPGSVPASAEAAVDEIRSPRTSTRPEQGRRPAQQEPAAQVLWEARRRLVCRKADDVHDYKYLAAVWEDAGLVRPPGVRTWSPRRSATTCDCRTRPSCSRHARPSMGSGEGADEILLHCRSHVGRVRRRGRRPGSGGRPAARARRGGRRPTAEVTRQGPERPLRGRDAGQRDRPVARRPPCRASSGSLGSSEDDTEQVEKALAEIGPAAVPALIAELHADELCAESLRGCWPITGQRLRRPSLLLWRRSRTCRRGDPGGGRTHPRCHRARRHEPPCRSS